MTEGLYKGLYVHCTLVLHMRPVVAEVKLSDEIVNHDVEALVIEGVTALSALWCRLSFDNK